MNISDAQQDIRRAYVAGGPGAIVSGLVWLVAAFVQTRSGTASAFAALFFGGMLIFPLSTLGVRSGFRREKESGENPLGMTALESTIMKIGGFLGAWLLLPVAPHYVFPLAAVAVGTHYLVFKTVYGDRLFWLFGAVITVVGLLVMFKVLHFPGGPVVAVGIVELAFGVILTLRAR
jgi:hypothetical protein